MMTSQFQGPKDRHIRPTRRFTICVSLCRSSGPPDISLVFAGPDLTIGLFPFGPSGPGPVVVP